MSVTAARQVRFYFDFSDPASWLAAAQLVETCARRSALMSWHPILPASQPAPAPEVAAYRSIDLRRFADHLGIPLAERPDGPIDARAACLIARGAAESGREGDWCRRLLEWLWVDAVRPADESALTDMAAKLGLDPARSLGALRDPGADGILMADREQARASGLFALPACVTSGQLFVGHDRVTLLDEALDPSGPTTPFNRWFGARALSLSAGVADYELIVTPRLTNRRGVAHGGAVTSLLDSALGAAVVSAIAPEEWCATLQLDVQFREPVRLGRIVCQGRMVKRGRHAAFAEGEVRDADGRALAVGSGSWYVWSRRPAS